MRKVFALVTGSLLFLCVVKFQAEEDQAYKQLMKDVGATFGSLGKDIQAKNGDSAAEDAQKLAGLFQQVEAFWVKSKTEDAIAFAQAGEKASAQAAESAKANNLEQASAAVSDIGKTCKGCHGAHKPKK
jgi:hypothetical protein